MKVLLDTNIIIHREADRIYKLDIGQLFYWLDKLKYDKYIHPLTIIELNRYKDQNSLKSMNIKIESYNQLKHQAPLSETIKQVSNQVDTTLNDFNDMQILNEVFENRIDILISEDKKIHTKAKFLGIADRVYRVQSFLEKVMAENPDKIAYGGTLSAYGFDKDLKFDFMLTNPPYGKTWAPDKKALSVGPKGAIIDKRFVLKNSYKEEAVTGRVNDGQLMFVLHMLSKMKDTELGSRIASVHNGSALFTGEEPIFLFTNRKAKNRKGKVQLINATSEKFYYKMRKPLGKKRVEFSTEHIPVIEKTFLNFEENEYSKIFDNEDFGYAQIAVNRPLKDEKGNIIYEGKGGALSLSKGKPKPDPKLKDSENIPLKEDIQDFFEREVLPFADDAWWDKKVTKIGYEINFAKYFYKHQPPRALTDIAKDIFAIEQETDGLLKEIIEA